ncbi:phage baseplate assembly protein [Pluralibacter gergoviae]
MGLKDVNIPGQLASLGRRLRLVVDRAVVRMVTDSLGRQNLQLQSLADETNDDVERFQNYGFSSHAPVGSEAIVLAVGGRRDGMVAIAVENKGLRPQNAEVGDVCIYHQEGHIIRLKKDGVIEITGKTVNLVADESCEIISKQITVTGPTSFSDDITVSGKSFLGHVHPETGSTTKPPS